jgi:hypothetical protein
MIEGSRPDPEPDPYLWLMDPDPYLWLMDPDRIQEAQKHVDPVDPEHW